MKLIAMVLAAALIPAAALANPNTTDPQDQQNPTTGGMNQNAGSSGANQTANAPGSDGAAPQGAAPQAATPQQTVEVEAFEWSTGQGRLGLMLMGLTPQLRSYFGAPNTSGLLVAQVAPDSPASRAGVRVGDVITQVDKQNVQSADDIVAATSSTTNTNKVQIRVIRNKKAMNLQATLGTSSNPPTTNPSRMNEPSTPGNQNPGT